MPTSIPIKEFQDEMNRLNQVFHEIFKEGDRAAAVLMGAELDRLASALLENHLLSKVKNVSSSFLELNGPLEAFAARIELAYRIGLIPPVMHHDLQLVRKIRNEFAHGTVGLDFTYPPVQKLASELIMGRQAIEEMFSRTAGAEAKPIPPPKPLDLFRLTSSILLGRLCIMRYQASKLKPVWPSFFAPVHLLDYEI